MANVTLKGVYKFYEKSETPSVKNFNLEINDKEFVVFVGPSGCGKSTTLRMIAGLEEITYGDVLIDGKKVNNIEPKDRDIAMVFQNYALYPHMTVYKNMAFGLTLAETPVEERDENGKIKKDKDGNPIYVTKKNKDGSVKKDKNGDIIYKTRKYTKSEIKEKVEEAAKILDITQYLDRKPMQLSGGQRQRVAIGRSIVRSPKVFLFDEPLSNLDAKLRNQMRAEILLLRKRINTTFIYVTHDQVEAMTLADRIVIMKDGVIQQTGTPTEVFEHPANVFVAGFIGTPQMNFLEAKTVISGDEYFIEVYGQKFAVKKEVSEYLKRSGYPEKEIILGVRPEHITVLTENTQGTVSNVMERFGGGISSEITAEIKLSEMMEASFICTPLPRTKRP